MSKRILVLSTFDFGGAGEAAFRITRAMRELDHEAVMLVKQKTKAEKFVIQVHESVQDSLATRVAKKVYSKLRNRAAQVINYRNSAKVMHTNSDYYFLNKDESVGLKDISTLTEILTFKPDLILVCWVSEFINTRNMNDLAKATSAPLYWLTTDMSPMTGGCHYAWDCLGYTYDCANCPAILTQDFKQQAKQNLEIKLKNVHGGHIKVLAGSEWCRRQALASTLFRNQQDIPLLNGLIDQTVFNDNCRAVAKQIFRINSTDKVIFTGSSFTHEKRKGIEYLVEALNKLYARLDTEERIRTRIMIAGNNVLDNDLVQRIEFSVVPIDFIKDDRLLSLAYQAADVFICASIEDAGPAMVNEALACGTPVVGFDLGFVSDIVEHGQNGFRVPLKNTTIMSECIQILLNLSLEESVSFSQCAIQSVTDKVSKRSLENLILTISN